MMWAALRVLGTTYSCQIIEIGFIWADILILSLFLLHRQGSTLLWRWATDAKTLREWEADTKPYLCGPSPKDFPLTLIWAEPWCQVMKRDGKALPIPKATTTKEAKRAKCWTSDAWRACPSSASRVSYPVLEPYLAPLGLWPHLCKVSSDHT